MYKFFSSTKVIYSFIFSLFLFILYFCFWSSFYFDNEYLLKPILSSECALPIKDFNSFPDTWRLLSPIFSFLYSKSKLIQFYDTFILFILLILLFLLIHAWRLIFSTITRNKLLLISLLVFLLMIPYFLEVNNKFIAFLLVVCSIIYCKLYYIYKNKKYFIVSVICLIFSLVCRLEIALFALFFVTFFAFLFEHDIFKKVFLIFLITSTFFCCYVFFLNTYSNEESMLMKYEIESQDRQGKFIIEELKQLDKLKIFALNRFVQDESILGGVYVKLIKEIDVFSFQFFLTFKDLFLIISKDFFKRLLKPESAFFLIYLSFLFFCTIKLLKIKTRQKAKVNIIKYWIFTFFIFSTSIFTSCYLQVPIALLNLILSMFMLYVLYDIIRLFSNNRAKLDLIYVLVFILALFNVYRNENLSVVYERNNDFGNSVWQILEEIDEDEKIPVFANAFDNIYSCKLEVFDHSKYINHYFLDMQFFRVYKFYKLYNEEFFGAEYFNLTERLRRLEKENVVLIINDRYLKFLKEYTLKYHFIKVQETPYKNMRTYDLNDDMELKVFSIKLFHLSKNQKSLSN